MHATDEHEPSSRRAGPAIVVAHHADVEFFTDDELDQLDRLGTLLTRQPISDWSTPRAEDCLARAEVIVGHWGCPRITDRHVDRAPRLGLIAYAAGSVKGTVDRSVLDRGIRVTSGREANAEPVAEFTLAAILLSGKDAFWRRDQYRHLPSAPPRRAPVAIGNWDKTIGIVGASAVGRRVLEHLAAFPQFRVLVHDPYLDARAASRLGVTVTTLADLCRTVDVLTLHAPDLPATRGMIGQRELALLRSGATVINTARGALVDQDALVSELRAGRLYAVLDVTDPEPLPAEHPLRTLPTAFVTPHLAGSEGSELRRLATHAIDEVRRWIDATPARHQITAATWDVLA